MHRRGWCPRSRRSRYPSPMQTSSRCCPSTSTRCCPRSVMASASQRRLPRSVSADHVYGQPTGMDKESEDRSRRPREGRGCQDGPGLRTGPRQCYRSAWHRVGHLPSTTGSTRTASRSMANESDNGRGAQGYSRCPRVASVRVVVVGQLRDGRRWLPVATSCRLVRSRTDRMLALKRAPHVREGRGRTGEGPWADVPDAGQRPVDAAQHVGDADLVGPGEFVAAVAAALAAHQSVGPSSDRCRRGTAAGCPRPWRGRRS